MYFLSIGFIKLSMSSLYMAIFPQKKAHWACWTVSAIAIGWMVSATLSTVFMCNPPRRTWDPFHTEESCIDYPALLFATSALNIATDLILMAIPIPLVLQLKVDKQKKIWILLTFAVGGAYVTHPANPPLTVFSPQSGDISTSFPLTTRIFFIAPAPPAAFDCTPS